MRMKVHELKILPEYYDAVRRGDKRFEIRKDDRDYQVGDYLLLSECDDEGNLVYTDAGDGWQRHKTMCVKVLYILRNCPEYGLADGYCIMAIDSYKVGEREIAKAFMDDNMRLLEEVARLRAEITKMHANAALKEAHNETL